MAFEQCDVIVILPMSNITIRRIFTFHTLLRGLNINKKNIMREKTERIIRESRWWLSYLRTGRIWNLTNPSKCLSMSNKNYRSKWIALQKFLHKKSWFKRLAKPSIIKLKGWRTMIRYWRTHLMIKQCYFHNTACSNFPVWASFCRQNYIL